MEAGILVAGSPLQANQLGGLNVTDTITQADLDSVLDDAVAYWDSQGWNTSILESVSFELTDLRNRAIGMQHGNTIYIDVDAAGHGWYVDSDVSTQETFGGMDLYTTVTHELGHVLGLSDVYMASASDDIMYGYLQSGERRAMLSAGGQPTDDFFSHFDEEVMAF